MNMRKLNKFEVDEKIMGALREDINSEDLSTNAIYRDDREASVCLIMKEDGVIAGLGVFQRVFELLDPQVSFEMDAQDGDQVKKGQVVGKVYGKISTLLSGERVALNYLQRMSGIATYTRACVEALGDPNIKILDTRKTTPNLRIFEKYSVKVGGGFNHRYNLSDGIMLKDNHIDAAGSITRAVEMAREYAPFVKKIEIEVESLEGVEEALQAGADIIMLDNMSLENVKKACDLIGDRAVIECSGNINLDTVSRYRGLSIDYVSMGSLTHSAPILDISMKNLRYEDETAR